MKVNIPLLLKKTASNFIDDNSIKLAASLSYYTIFAIAPLLIVVMTLAGWFFGADAVQGKIYYQLNELIGNSTALEVQTIIKNIQTAKHTTAGTVIGVIALVVGATGVFTEIQDSINFIWSIKVKPKKGWLKLITNRLLSFSLVVSLGFILLVSLTANAVLDLLSDRLIIYFANVAVYFFYILNYVIIFAVISFMFAVIFKVLPDARIRWKDAFVGSVFTAMMFLIGKFLIGYYLGNSNIGATYGAAASVIILLLWVYYSSIILFFGAEFTQVYATEYGGGVIPYDNAVLIVKQEAREIRNPVTASKQP